MAGWFLIISLSFFIVFPVFSWSNETVPRGKGSQTLGASTSLDERAPLLKGYLKAKGSPLAPYAEEMIVTSDKYQFDWRLLPAIAGKESSFGRKIPWDKQEQKQSYNAWGWGIYGNQVLSFSSWEEGIEKVGAGLRDGYFNKNLMTLEDIMRYFTPRSDGSWARDVSYFMEEMGR